MFKGAFAIVRLVIPAFIFFSCSDVKISPQEERALSALEEIHTSMNTDISYEQFYQLLNTAKGQIENLKGTNKKNACFMGAVDKCYASYEIAGKAWQKKMNAKDDKHRQDMDMTLSFSLSFAALNIEKANDCFK